MKRLKRFYKANRIYCIMMIFSFLCCVFICGTVVYYFYNQSNNSVYGDRLYDIDNYDIDGDITKINDYFNGNENVKSVDVVSQGKIIYITLEVNAEFANEDIQNLCTSLLDVMTPEILDYVDLQFTIDREGFIPYSGSKSSNNQVITWSNYKFSVEEDSEED